MSHPGQGRSQPLQPPFEAYDGSKPFLFVSYSHADIATVYPELSRLHNLGCRIWYDEGIVPTTEWPDSVAGALKGGHLFVVFLSPSAVASRNVRNEVNFAVKHSKRLLAIHVEETTLTAGLDLQIGSIQAIKKYWLTEEQYHRKLRSALPEDLFDTHKIQKGITSVMGMEFRLIPKGSFRMGSRRGELDEQPVHDIVVESPFYLGVCEVTQAQYERTMGVGRNRSRFRGPNRPVETVSWYEAIEFCRKLSEEEGVFLRLPTEAEWEYACRAGTATDFYLGDSSERLGKYAWFGGNSGGETHDVGELRANAWGLSDMVGNVWEWCQSLYAPYPYRTADGTESLEGDAPRVVRGGSWYGIEGFCRSAYRYFRRPGRRSFGIGFRVAMPLP
jgi:formylglycine-generating enzyme required for sulfatase activity